MSDNGPTITVTRGRRNERSRTEQSSSSARSRSVEWGLPGPGAVVSGMIRGVRTAWWVGLGVVAVFRDAGGQVFDALVEDGKSWEQAQRERAEAMARRVRRATEESDAIRATEERVQKEINDVLRRISVPSRDEIEGLRKEIDALGDRIEQLAHSIEKTGT